MLCSGTSFQPGLENSSVVVGENRDGVSLPTTDTTHAGCVRLRKVAALAIAGVLRMNCADLVYWEIK